jgi:DNA-binding XRE family transcriptional regulator
MDKKYNLSEAAAEILAASVNGKRAQRDSGPSKLSGDVAYGTKEVGDIGTRVTKTNDMGPSAYKGAPTATPPGATPPVGSEPMKRLSGDLNQQAKGRADLVANDENDQCDIDDADYKKRAARMPSSLAQQKFAKNAGATFQSYGEAVEEEDYEEEEFEEDDVLEEGEKEDAEGHEDAAQDKKMMKKMMKKKDMKEDIDALLQGENLSEEFASKAATIFEAAVNSRVTEIAEELQVELQEQFSDAIDHLKEEFTTKIDDYLNYMVEEWMKENELAIESGLRTEIVEDFIGGMRNLFAEHYIDIPEEKVDVVNELAAKVEELEEKLNEEMHRSIQFKKEINEHKKLEAVQTVCEGLTQTQVEKLKSLAETVEFTTEEEFADKLETLKEAYTGTSSVKFGEKSALEEGIDVEEVKSERVSHDPLIDAVARSISKSVIK